MLPTFLTKPDPELFLSDNYLVLDFETEGEGKGSAIYPNNRIVCACWWYRGEKKQVYGGEFDMADLLADLDECDFWVAHNAKFEMAWLIRCGWDIGSKMCYDTMIGDYTIAGNRTWKLDLNSVASRYNFGAKENVTSRWIKTSVPCSHIPANWLLNYCHKDVDLTRDVMLVQRKQLFEKGLQKVFYSRMLATPVLTDIERRGLQLDKERVNKVLANYRMGLEIVEAELQNTTGGINLNSNKQLSTFLFDTMKFDSPKAYNGKIMETRGGAVSVSAEAISALKPKNQKQAKFIKLYKEYNSYTQAITKYLEKFEECCEKDGGVLYGELHQTRTATHRLSSTGKNYAIQLQNIQRDFKPMFTTRNPDWVLCEADESQLEYRIAVDLSDDVAGTADILNGADVHYLTASILFDGFTELEPKDVEYKKLRTMAKASTFKPTYGGTTGTPREMEYFKAFKAKHEQMTAMQEGWVNTVLREKKLTLPTGFIAYWPDCKVTRSGYVTETSKIYNLPVQNMATAEIVPLALVCLWHRLRDAGVQSYLTNTVHDSIIAEVHPEEKEIYEKLAKKALTTDAKRVMMSLYNYEIKIPLNADVEFRRHWGETKDWKERFLN